MRNPHTSLLALTLCATALASGSAAFADARLVAARPADGSITSNVHVLSLSFSEPVVDKQSGIDLEMTAMPGMASHAPMKVSGFATMLAADGRTVNITLPRALPAGSYSLHWRMVTAQGGVRSEGQTRFSVR
ncbi:hypothetical protein BH10PSE13_BH10PSE13_23970 [soil metagenome]